MWYLKKDSWKFYLQLPKDIKNTMWLLIKTYKSQGSPMNNLGDIYECLWFFDMVQKT
jgi:hypothetical protein